ncbi:hypothetical protein [Phocaeicola oris]|uniref:hypothetical protein n=1 Tax=Phocaeicola oris TaxID=2896850 RepID=UPI00234E6F7A|nr:hypothetical protein [Phocaeicola oris]MCE2615375.1 hypothetical protein [Phocaeicola oris]
MSELLDNASTKEKALASRSLTLLREKMSRRAARQHFFEERCTGEPLDNAFTEEKVLSELPDSASTGEKASNLYNL